MSDFQRTIARVLRVDARTVRRWCASGVVPGAYQTKGGHWRLRRPARLKLEISRKRSRAATLAEIVFSFTLTHSEKVAIGRVADALDFGRAQFEAGLAKGLARLSPACRERICSGSLIDDYRRSVRAREFSLIARGRLPEEIEPADSRECDDYILPKAWRAIDDPGAPLFIAARKLELMGEPVTSGNLARQLRISVATLYRRFTPAQFARARLLEMRGEVPSSRERGRRVNTRHDGEKLLSGCRRW